MNLKTYIRESVTFTIPLNDRGVAFAPGEDYNLIFTAKRTEQDEDADALFQKASGAGITLDETAALVSLVPDDTTDLDAGNIVYDIRAQHVVTGARKTLARGVLKLELDVTREAETSVPVITTQPPLPFAPTAAAINAAEEKATPANADRIPGTDSEDGYKLKWFSWNTIKTIFFGDATTKANAAQAAAISAAASDATTKANAAQAAAISSAATDATTKANAAQATAISTAATDATTKANAAQSAAATDATTKANAAQAAAISAAATDATTKANAAQATAISTAATDATTKANAAQAAAISTAATDATTKANAAQAAAISAAATDATTKANAAQAAAISAAATDATTKANAAQAAAIAASVGLSGNQTVAGNKTLSGQLELTGQAAVNGTSAMNRDLVLDLLGSEDFYILREEWAKGSDWTAMLSGSGVIYQGSYVPALPNKVTFQTGTTSASVSGMSYGVTASMSPSGLIPWKYIDVSQTGASVADVKIRIGFHDSGSGDIFTSGAFTGFDYDPASSANWRFYDQDNNTYTDTGVAVLANTSYKLTMRSTTSGQIYWSINNGSETLRTGARDYLLCPASQIKSTSSNNRGIHKDFTSMIGNLNR